MFYTRISKYFFALFILSGILFAQQVQDWEVLKEDSFWNKRSLAKNILNRIVDEQTNMLWSTNNHTASFAPVGAVGPEKYLNKIKGLRQNIVIPEVLKEAVRDGINVIFVIGDGMGVNQMSLPVYYNIAAGNNQETYFQKIMNEGITGLSITHPYGEIVGSSAACGTALASGQKTRTNMLGLDHNGFPVETILDVAEESGLRTGIITEASISHATPGAFYGHSINRSNEQLISKQLVEDNEIEVLLGGGAAYFIPEGTHMSDFQDFSGMNKNLQSSSWRKDNRNLIDEMKAKGYHYTCNLTQMIAVPAETEKLIGLFSAGGINARIDRDDENTGEPSLVEMTAKALELLDKKEGYFLMIEAARIDWEAHDNDAGAVLKAVQEMDEVLGVCYQKYSANPEKTIVLFTADHETGGLNIAYYGLPYSERKPVTLESGETYSKSKNSLRFEDYLKLGNQKKSYGKIFENINSPEELFQRLNYNLGSKVTKEEAELLYEVYKDSK